MPDGTEVERIVLRGAEGFEAGIIPYGAVLHTLHVPDREKHSDDIVLGHDAFDEYLAQRKFLGATIGRYANRIAGGQFTLDGAIVKLDVNNGPNMLHGGNDGFDRKLWRIVEMKETPEPAVAMDYSSADGEGGFPGKLEARVTYRITGPTELAVTFEATTDRPTVVNLTNHSFFNLDGALSESPDSRPSYPHRRRSFPGDGCDLDPAAGPAASGRRHAVRFSQAARDRFAHPRTIMSSCGAGAATITIIVCCPAMACALPRGSKSPRSGRAMELLTNQPGLQFYSGNFLDGTLCRQRRPALPAIRCVLPGTADLAGYAQSSRLSVGAARSRQALPARDRLSFLDGVTRNGAGQGIEEVPTTTLSAERCHLGEGPTYDATTDTAWWFDILERRLFEAEYREADV